MASRMSHPIKKLRTRVDGSVDLDAQELRCAVHVRGDLDAADHARSYAHGIASYWEPDHSHCGWGRVCGQHQKQALQGVQGRTRVLQARQGAKADVLHTLPERVVVHREHCCEVVEWKLLLLVVSVGGLLLCVTIGPQGRTNVALCADCKHLGQKLFITAALLHLDLRVMVNAVRIGQNATAADDKAAAGRAVLALALRGWVGVVCMMLPAVYSKTYLSVETHLPWQRPVGLRVHRKHLWCVVWSVPTENKDSLSKWQHQP